MIERPSSDPLHTLLLGHTVRDDLTCICALGQSAAALCGGKLQRASFPLGHAVQLGLQPRLQRLDLRRQRAFLTLHRLQLPLELRLLRALPLQTCRISVAKKSQGTSMSVRRMFVVNVRTLDA